MIRLANTSDIDVLMNITNACANYMISNNIYQWNESYPSKGAFLNDIKREELYIQEHNAIIMGCIVIGTFMDEEYIPIKWLTPNQNNIYIHRLAVHPDYQGKGFAKQFMDFAENYAIENNYASIRLDTFSQNKRNQKFYELRDYKKLGDIYFPKQSEYPFYCYELVL